MVAVPCGRLARRRSQLGPFSQETARVVSDTEPVRGKRDSGGLVLPLAQVLVSPLWCGDCGHWGLIVECSPPGCRCHRRRRGYLKLYGSFDVLQTRGISVCLLFVEICVLDLCHCDAVAFTPHAGVNHPSVMEFSHYNMARH